MKVLFILDDAAIRRAELDPAAFVESLKRAALTPQREVYASGMIAGKRVWSGTAADALELKLEGEDVTLLNRLKPRG